MSDLPTFRRQHACSVLLITLDSCRYDSFAAAQAPCLRAVGPLYQAMAPGSFTYSSHAAIFMGFTPGVAQRAEPHVNPKYGKILRAAGGGLKGKAHDFMVVRGRNVIDGMKKQGYRTIGTGAVGWFDSETDTGRYLTDDFEEFFYPGNTWSLKRQLQWLGGRLQDGERPAFAFLNVGETHVPYYYDGAPWRRDINPCVPFATRNDADECRRRQVQCVEYVDKMLGGLLDAFAQSTVVVCADHGDCWGEDGLWEHGISHPKVLEVPLMYRLGSRPAA